MWCKNLSVVLLPHQPNLALHNLQQTAGSLLPNPGMVGWYNWKGPRAQGQGQGLTGLAKSGNLCNCSINANMGAFRHAKRTVNTLLSLGILGEENCDIWAESLD